MGPRWWSQPRHRALPAIREPPGCHSMPGVKLPVPRPAVRPEASEDRRSQISFLVLLFAILRSRGARQEEFGPTPFGSPQTYRIESPYFNTG